MLSLFVGLFTYFRRLIMLDVDLLVLSVGMALSVDCWTLVTVVGCCLFVVVPF